MGKLCFGVDLGGTTVKMGIFTVEGSLLEDWEIPTRKEDKGAYILDDIAAVSYTHLTLPTILRV